MTDQLDTAAIRAQMEALDGHTPGPWSPCAHLANDDENGCSCGYRGVVWGPGQGAMAICQPGHDPDPVGEEGLGPERYDRRTEVLNARLIAVAPDMRATILALCDALDEARAESERLRGVLAAIVDGIPTPARAEAYRTDGEPSKLDKCCHGLAMYEDCGECVSDFARAALAKKGGKK